MFCFRRFSSLVLFLTLRASIPAWAEVMVNSSPLLFFDSPLSIGPNQTLGGSNTAMLDHTLHVFEVPAGETVRAAN